MISRNCANTQGVFRALHDIFCHSLICIQTVVFGILKYCIQRLSYLNIMGFFTLDKFFSCFLLETSIFIVEAIEVRLLAEQNGWGGQHWLPLWGWTNIIVLLIFTLSCPLMINLSDLILGLTGIFRGRFKSYYVAKM